MALCNLLISIEDLSRSLFAWCERTIRVHSHQAKANANEWVALSSHKATSKIKEIIRIRVRFPLGVNAA